MAWIVLKPTLSLLVRRPCIDSYHAISLGRYSTYLLLDRRLNTVFLGMEC